MDLRGQRTLLTGATGGLGGTIARALAGRGARLVLTGRRLDVLEPLAEELGAETIVSDLSDRDEPVRLAEAAGEVDVFVSNAGLPASGPLAEYTVEQLDRAEVDVAPLSMRAAGMAASVAPETVARLNRLIPVGDVAHDIVAAQRSKR